MHWSSWSTSVSIEALTSSVSPQMVLFSDIQFKVPAGEVYVRWFHRHLSFLPHYKYWSAKSLPRVLHLRFDQHRPQRGPNCCYRWLQVVCMFSSRCPLVSSAPSSTWSSWRPSRTATAYTQSHLTSWFAVWYINLFSNVHICPIIFNGRYIGCWYTYTKHPPDLYVLSFFNILLYMAYLLVIYQTPLPPDGERQCLKHCDHNICQAHVRHPLWVGFDNYH